MRKSASKNDLLRKEIKLLNRASRDKQAPIWKDIAYRLSASRKNRAEVNISRLNRYTEGNEVVAVPGKVLASGLLNHALTVAAFSFSGNAREKVVAAGGKCLSFEDLVKENPKGTNVRIMG